MLDGGYESILVGEEGSWFSKWALGLLGVIEGIPLGPQQVE